MKTTIENAVVQSLPDGQQSPQPANVSAQKPRVAPAKGKAGKKAIRKVKAPKAKAARAPKGKVARKDKIATADKSAGKTETIIAMISTKSGATLDAIMKATGWQRHSVRGLISTLGTKMGLAVESFRNDAKERCYRLKKAA